jgi:hypothetical protein
MSTEHNGKPHPETFTVNPLTYYQKPLIGNERLGQAPQEHYPPVQLLFPTGGFSIGVIPKTENRDANAAAAAADDTDGYSFVIVTSPPMSEDTDNVERLWLKVAFCCLAIVNIIITSLMFFRAEYVDTSKVQIADPNHGGYPQIFERVSEDRRYIESINYGFTVAVLFVGTVSVIFENALGISAYCLAVVLNFMLGTYSLPLFVYAYRYLLDVFALYLALVFRTRLTCTFLPLHIHRS